MMTNNNNSNKKDLEMDLDLTEPYLPTSSTSLSVIPTPLSGTAPCNYLYEKASQNPRKETTKMLKMTRGASSTGKPPRHYRKPDPYAPNITEPCTECGKTFWSVKALFGHMRCHPERQWRGINPPPSHLRAPAKVTTCSGAASASAPPAVPAAVTSTIRQINKQYLLCGAEEVNETSQMEYEVATYLLILASGELLISGGVGSANATLRDHDHRVGHEPEEAACHFECSSCKKVFGSHQALGGHRASHKNVKGCFAITRSDCDHGCAINNVDQPGSSPSGSTSTDGKESLEEGDDKSAMVALCHQCGVCFKLFSSGQALGGHMRCHGERASEGGSSPVVNLFITAPSALLPEPEICGLDLNLPAPSDDGLPLDLRLSL